MRITNNKYLSFLYALDYEDFKDQFNSNNTNDMDVNQDNGEETNIHAQHA